MQNQRIPAYSEVMEHIRHVPGMGIQFGTMLLTCECGERFCYFLDKWNLFGGPLEIFCQKCGFGHQYNNVEAK